MDEILRADMECDMNNFEAIAKMLIGMGPLGEGLTIRAIGDKVVFEKPDRRFIYYKPVDDKVGALFDREGHDVRLLSATKLGGGRLLVHDATDIPRAEIIPDDDEIVVHGDQGGLTAIGMERTFVVPGDADSATDEIDSVAALSELLGHVPTKSEMMRELYGDGSSSASS